MHRERRGDPSTVHEFRETENERPSSDRRKERERERNERIASQTKECEKRPSSAV